MANLLNTLKAIFSAKFSAIGLVLILFMGGPAWAQTAQHLDDRSNAGTLVASYYNAINAREFARAWSYWGSKEKPSSSYDAFLEGFASTLRVDVFIANVQSEGAAGTVFHAVSVAINAWQTDGTSQAYSGCFFARMTQPALQTRPYKPLRLYGASLQAVEQPYFTRAPENCEP